MTDLSIAASIDTDVDLAIRPGLRLLHMSTVFAGGFLGTMARYALFDAHPSPTSSVDWVLLLVNGSGAFILGVLVATVFSRRPDAHGLRLFLATGVLGGWTTYSAIIGGTITLAHSHHLEAAGGSLLLELVTPPLGAALGLILGARLNRSSS